MNRIRMEEGAGRRRAVDFEVAVVGGGMVGAATALAVAASGLRVALLEAQPPPPWQAQAELDLRVVGLAPSSVALLGELGVWPAIREARVGVYRRMQVWDGAGGAAIDFDAAAQGQRALGYIVENRLLQWQLWNALEVAGVTRLCPCQVLGFDEEGERLRLSLDAPLPGLGDSLSARLVVAADGARSPLREAAGITTWGRDYQQRAIVAHVATERAHEETAWQRFLSSGPLALLPLADGRSSVVWSLSVAEAQAVAKLDDGAFMQALGLASDFRLGRILSTTPRMSFPLQLQLARRYAAGRLLLLGDAAHVVHPLAGQGVNLGLRDVAELAACLKQAVAAGDDPGAEMLLQRYERRRRSADTLDALGFDALARIYAARSPLAVALRTVGIRLCDRSPSLKRRLIGHAGGLE